MKKIFFLIAASLCAVVGSAQTRDAISMGDVVANPGTTVVLPVCLTNSKTLSGFEFHLVLPEGVAVEGNATTERTDGFFIASHQTDGVYRYSVLSLDGSTVTGHSGAVLDVTLEVGESVPLGEYELRVQSATSFAEDGDETVLADATAKLTVEKKYDAIGGIGAAANKTECRDLLGRRVANPVRGIYIINGKKAVISK